MSNNGKKTDKMIKSYWNGREARAEAAKLHSEAMKKTYPSEIEYSIKFSKIYGMPKFHETEGAPEQIFINTNSISAFCETYDENANMCILNFASYKNPGGGFINGSNAQEESLCHESALYEVLSSNHFDEYYGWNRKNLNHSLYKNRAIYSPDIVVEHNGEVFPANILTCAAPNYHAASKSNAATLEQNNAILVSRMQFIADILEENEVEIFIAGVFGCGVFGQDPTTLADIYQTTRWGEHMKMIIHAVPGDDENAEVFRKIFGDK